jgi:hypothetical protein
MFDIFKSKKQEPEQPKVKKLNEMNNDELKVFKKNIFYQF